MKNIGLILLLAVALLTSCTTKKNTAVNATRPPKISEAKNDVERYLLTFYPVAVEHMEKHRIPASITLAQAVLEGGAGRSKLVAEANNHFGVKADKRWKGKTVTSYDNGRWCKFRAYKNALESYEDHSRFLLVNNRYDFLFDLKISDYKSWARGLKKAGYAEDQEYDTKLINIIERYHLYEYDRYTTKELKKNSRVNKSGGNGSGRVIMKANGLLYIIAESNDTFESLSKELGISKRKLRKYNDLYKGYTIKEGDIIYLEKKNVKANKKYEFHTTRAGESLYSISQKYGIRIDNIYKMNPQYKGNANLKVGDVIRLR